MGRRQHHQEGQQRGNLDARIAQRICQIFMRSSHKIIVNDDLADITTRGQQRTGHQDARQLTVRAGGRLQGDGVHAGDLEERRFQPRHDLERALGQGFGLVGMHPGQALHLRHTLVDARVVLHGARAKRIHA